MMDRVSPTELTRLYSETAETHCIHLMLDNTVNITELAELKEYSKRIS